MLEVQAGHQALHFWGHFICGGRVKNILKSSLIEEIKWDGFFRKLIDNHYLSRTKRRLKSKKSLRFVILHCSGLEPIFP